ncbi:MAG: 16S rRNA (cytosine(1402)-N(4))-methyltransferase RsmH [bacterium]|nr:16S rRNA (cytosine(1402)-N(4))-methyltransferase RsmH [bacterium]
MTSAPHVPVLLEETIELLQPRPGRRYVDGTFGFGGHATALLDAGAEVLGLDLDDRALATCRDLAAARPECHCHYGSFRDLSGALAACGWRRVDGVLLDLGVNSLQLDDPELGFSYRADGPLDLRFDREQGRPAAALVAELDETALADIFWKWGEERASRRLARAVVRARAEEPVDTTGRLAAVITDTLPRGVKPMPTLSRVFQALRIAVNEELEALDEAVESLPGVLNAGGRFVVIAYHSLEDRLVKRFIDRERKDCLCPTELPVCACKHARSLRRLTRGAVKAGPDEAARNPRSRSARLRAAERL